MGAPWTATAAKDDLTLVSRASGSLGPGGDRASFAAAISADGRFVAFESFARNLSTEDVDAFTGTHVLVRDTLTGTTALISRGAGAVGPGGDSSSAPAISADGRFVAFQSVADNLSTADDDTVTDVFVRDTLTGTTTLVSRGPGAAGPAADGDSVAPAISPDGRFVAFQSSADNLVAAADDAVTNVFVRDTATNTNTLVSRGAGASGPAADGGSVAAAVSSDGRFVAFQSAADNLSNEDDDTVTDVFVRDTVANTTTLVSRASGPSGFPGDGGSSSPAISPDGRFVAFSSGADNLSNEDDDTVTDVFVRDTVAATTTLVSRAPGAGGPGGDDPSSAAAISADGRFVAFQSDADNLSNDDDDDASDGTDVFVRDTATGATTFVSRAQGPGGFRGDGDSFAPAVSADGRFVAFESVAANLSAEDVDAFTDVFLRDVLGPPPPPAPPPGGGTAAGPTPPALTLSRATLSGRYRARGLRAALVLRGTSSSEGTFAIRLRRTRGPRAVGLLSSASLRLRLAAAGPFVARLPLPRRLAPGRYALAAAGLPVPGRAGTVTLPRPRLGIIHRAFASGVRDGAPALVVPRRTRIVFCNFRFAVLPVRGRVTTEWRSARGRSDRTLRPRAFRVSGFVRGRLGGSLAPGRYACTLRVRAQKLASVSIRVR